jgi:hypothetical protein
MLDVALREAEPLPCDFREERSGMEHGWRCLACKGWFSVRICDGQQITNRWWQPEAKCRLYAA